MGTCATVENYKCIKGLEKLWCTKDGIKNKGIYVNDKPQVICAAVY
jgi:hypothetical protein